MPEEPSAAFGAASEVSFMALSRLPPGEALSAASMLLAAMLARLPREHVRPTVLRISLDLPALAEDWRLTRAEHDAGLGPKAGPV